MVQNEGKEEIKQEIAAEAAPEKTPEPSTPKPEAADDGSDALDDYAKASLQAFKARKATKARAKANSKKKTCQC